MKPIIAISPNTKEDGCALLGRSYTDAILEAGGIPLIIPILGKEELRNLLRGVQGVVLSGGGDINPSMYNEERLPECGDYITTRDVLDTCILEVALSMKLPVMGICRGCQMINVYFGGTLYQDLPAQRGVHHRDRNTGTETRHEISIVEGTPLSNICPERFTVNSYHHQAIKDLGQGLMPMAFSDDGIIEAVCHKDYPFIRAYQWHPERMIFESSQSRSIFGEFINATKVYMEDTDD